MKAARVVAFLAAMSTGAAARAADVPDTQSATLHHDDQGFVVRSKDRAFELRLFGLVQVDDRRYLRAADTTDEDQLFVRRARPYLSGRTFGAVDYRLTMDLGQGSVRVIDAYAEARVAGRALRVRAGKFKQPFSYEQYAMSALTLPVYERSALDALTPARSVGIMVLGTVGDNVMDYAFGIASGSRDSDGGDEQLSKELIGRVAVRPWSRVTGLRGLRFGISATYGLEHGSAEPASLATPMGVQYFQFNQGVVAAGPHIRLTPEISYVLGPWGIAAQYLVDRHVVQNAGASAPVVTVPSHAFYVMTSVLVTGERRASYVDGIHPTRPLSFDHGIHGRGAVEIVARVSGLVVGPGVFDTRAMLADPRATARGVHELTLGVNWYLSRWVWIMANYEHSVFTTPLPLGGEGKPGLDTQDALGFRTTVMW